MGSLNQHTYGIQPVTANSAVRGRSRTCYDDGSIIVGGSWLVSVSREEGKKKKKGNILSGTCKGFLSFRVFLGSPLTHNVRPSSVHFLISVPELPTTIVIPSHLQPLQSRKRVDAV